MKRKLALLLLVMFLPGAAFAQVVAKKFVVVKPTPAPQVTPMAATVGVATMFSAPAQAGLNVLVNFVVIGQTDSSGQFQVTFPASGTYLVQVAGSPIVTVAAQ